MRRALRIVGSLTAFAGAALIAWSVLVWQWQDPFTGAYNRWEQRQLSQSFERRSAELRLPATATAAPSRSQVALAARRWRKASPVLRSRHREQLVLQACHPRFFATHRWLTYAVPVSVEPRTAATQDSAAVLAG